jgi:hypothetical protein
MSPILLAEAAADAAQPNHPLWYAVALGVGGVIGWFIEQRKSVAEIRKLNAEVNTLKSESIKNAGEVLVNVQEKRKQYRDSCIHCTQAASAFMGLISNQSGDVAALNAARETLCAAILDHTIPAYHDYCEWEHLRKTQEPQLLEDFITKDVVAELRRFAKWISVANHPNILAYINRTKAAASSSTLSPFRDLVRGVAPDNVESVKSFLSGALDEIIKASQ